MDVVHLAHALLSWQQHGNASCYARARCSRLLSAHQTPTCIKVGLPCGPEEPEIFQTMLCRKACKCCKILYKSISGAVAADAAANICRGKLCTCCAGMHCIQVGTAVGAAETLEKVKAEHLCSFCMSAPTFRFTGAVADFRSLLLCRHGAGVCACHRLRVSMRLQLQAQTPTRMSAKGRICHHTRYSCS